MNLHNRAAVWVLPFIYRWHKLPLSVFSCDLSCVAKQEQYHMRRVVSLGRGRDRAEGTRWGREGKKERVVRLRSACTFSA